MVLTNQNAEQNTVITTRTSEAPLARPAPINQEAVVTNILEKPVIENVIQKKNIEVHHKPVVQEIHEQKIIEVERQPIVQNISKGTIVEQQKTPPRFEEFGTGDLGEQERLKLERLHYATAPKVVQQQGAIQEVREGEILSEVVQQEFIEHHVQPIVTEVREQRVLQEVEHPVVRTIHEAPIIREVQSTVPMQQPMFTQQTGLGQGITTGTSSNWQSGPTLGTGYNVVTTTTSNTGLAATTSTTGSGPQAEYSNIAQHEGKVIGMEHGKLSQAEQANLSQHEKVVELFSQGKLPQGNFTGIPGATTTNAPLTGTGAPPTTQTTSTTQSSLGHDTQKQGFMARMKDKMHHTSHNK